MTQKLPTKLKLLKGTFKKSRENPDEPVPTKPLGDPPSGFDRQARALWRELSAMTVPGVLTEQDRWAAEVLCELMAKLRRHEELTSAERSQLTQCLIQLGLTPVSRSRITVAKPKEQIDPFTEFA